MASTRTVRGRMADSRHIELDEPIPGVKGAVEVVVRSIDGKAQANGEDVFEFIKRLRPGRRTKKDIDAQVREERGSWGPR